MASYHILMTRNKRHVYCPVTQPRHRWAGCRLPESPSHHYDPRVQTDYFGVPICRFPQRPFKTASNSTTTGSVHGVLADSIRSHRIMSAIRDARNMVSNHICCRNVSLHTLTSRYVSHICMPLTVTGVALSGELTNTGFTPFTFVGLVPPLSASPTPLSALSSLA